MACDTVGMVLQIFFQRYITRPKNFDFVVTEMKFCNRLVTANQGGKRNRNGKTIVVIFCHVFY